jgi:hypothetical protein
VNMHARIRTALDEGVTDRNEIVDHVVKGLSRAELVEMARPALRWQVGHIMRERVRRVERRTFHVPVVVAAKIRTAAAVKTASRTFASKPTDQDALRELLTMSWSMPSGERVLVKEATPEQLEERAGWLRSMAARNVETASMYEDAARTIRKAGVKNLAEVYAAEKTSRRQKVAA